MSKFILYTDKNNDFRWKFVAANDQVIARSSEPYRVKDDCLKSLAQLQKDITGATVDPVVQVAPTKGILKAGAAPAVTPAILSAVTPAVIPAVTPATAARPAVVTPVVGTTN